MHSQKHGLLALGLLGFAIACGGTVITQDGDTDGGTGGSGGSTGGSGGSTGGSGGSTGGSGGSTGGSGGSTGGSGGSTGGTGGVGGGSTCPPLPSCNWCGGEYVYDSSGCPIGYVCENGVDPCVTDPCFEPDDCPDGEMCIDMLCWPGGVSCSESECMEYTNPDGTLGCDCRWDCSDGNQYSSMCETYGGGSFSCDCFVNGVSNTSCGAGGGAGGPMQDPCSVDCCGFPK